MGIAQPLHVLMVDDDREDAFLMRRALLKLDAETVFNHEADSANFVDKVRDDTGDTLDDVDIILLDLNMPRLSGLEVLKALRSLSVLGQSTVVMFTTSESDADRSEAMRLGADMFVSKPSTTDGLAEFAQRLQSLH